MKVVKFWGGLGNQLFQYAFFLALRKHHRRVKADLQYYENHDSHNGYEVEKIFTIQLPEITVFERNLFIKTNNKLKYRILRKLLQTKNRIYIEEPQFHFHKNIVTKKDNAYLQGYWQHSKYIELVKRELRETLIFPEFEDPRDIKLESILQQNEDTVSIHIRRGDYLGHELLGNLCDITYYKKAIDYMNTVIKRPIFIFFSDDIDWCKENFSGLNSIFVDWNNGQKNFRDMQLMSLCEHNVIANSSFSWWGSWFNTNPNKIVIAPKKWIKEEIGDKNALLLNSFVLL